MAAARHVAIIMDGNGRWAAARGLPRSAGHRAGVEALRRTVRAAGDLGIEVLTVYAFSSENWSRPKAEVSDLLGLFRLFVDRDLKKLHENGVRVRMIGNRDTLSDDLLDLIRKAEMLTVDNRRLHLNIAFNYGSRDEIARVMRDLALEAAAGNLDASEISEDLISSRLDTAGDPPLDLLIRTGGDTRLSNFLMWQLSYAELLFVETHWPDFGLDDLASAISEFSGRERRYGGLGAAETATA
ncbi:di-trans,poly-cis-decaprenylcistransferase [Notoacmeibacter marinus]|uniref:Isoprenyl transferase n=1 Tax=Notoacmeibacter marinus TaxID=1876515 RepID=A0A231UW52_9HYPH|nr:isoprenyl transferase [Notoacmeibacter marinus]OXT00189.1 di-trans,poly-cis-decaprenylcistransferase [Notoacmeibacter marinus]